MGVIFSDTFTEVSNTNLTAHTPDTGTSWVERQNTATAPGRLLVVGSGDYARPSDSEDEVLVDCNINPAISTADCVISFDITNTPGVSNIDAAFVVFLRAVDVDNQYLVVLYPANANPDIVIAKEVAGSITDLDTANFGDLDDTTITISMIGTDISVKVDDVEQASASDSAHSSAGAIGWGAGNHYASTDECSTGWQVDNFTVTEPEDATGEPSGVAGTGGIGAVGTAFDFLLSPTGVAGTSGIGTTTPTFDFLVSPTGVVGIGALGTAAPLFDFLQTVSGNFGTTSVGTVIAITGDFASVTGTGLTASLGTITLNIPNLWEELDDTGATTWAEVDTEGDRG